MHLSDISCPCDTHSVRSNSITGDAANHLATVVLEHAAMTDFCGIPLASLRENSITELNLEGKGVGVPGAIVLSKLLPSAAALTSLKCAPARVFAFVSAPADTHSMPLPLAVSTITRFRSTSSRARSRPSGSASRRRGSASPPPSS